MPYSLLILSVALLGFAHYFPHLRALIGKPIEHPVRLKTNYTIGILCIFLPFTAWLLGDQPTNPAQIASVMWIFITSGGVSVLFMYWMDGYIETLVNAKNHKEQNDILRNNHDAEHKRQ